MPPPMISTFTLAIRLPSSSSLDRDLGAADDRGHRALRRVERLAERVELGLHAAPGIGRQHVAEALGRGVRAVRGGKGVVDPEVAELRQLRDERRVVLFLAFVEAGVLEAQDVARPASRATAAAALSPMQSSANATGRPSTRATSCATVRSDCDGSTPLGRPKCESRIALPPLSAISLMVWAWRSMRVASVTLPFSVGTLRSTRTSTRLFFTSASSRVRKRAMRTQSVRGRLVFRVWLDLRAVPQERIQQTADDQHGDCECDPLRGHGIRSAFWIRSACPSPRRYRPCGWRSPIRCRTRT